MKKQNFKLLNSFLKTIIACILFAFIFFPSNSAESATSLQTLRSGSNNLGLVGLWSLDGNDVTDKVYDRSGQGNNGTFVGGSTSTAKVIGKIGQAMSFDGVDDYINMQANFSSVVADNFTASAWVKKSTTTTTSKIPFQLNYTNARFAVRFSATSVWRAEYRAGTVSSSITADPGKWYHLTVTRSLNNVEFYVNGVLAGTASDAEWPTTISGTDKDGTIGASRADGIPTSHWQGDIDDVRIYNRVLSANEIKRLYSSGQAKYVTPSSSREGLLAHWTMDGADTNWASSTLTDRSGNGQNCTIDTLSGSSSPVPGILGQAFLLTTGADQVVCPQAFVEGLDKITVSAWVKPSLALTSVEESIASNSNDSVQRTITLSRNSSEGVSFTVRTTSTVTVSSANSVTADNDWHHVVGIYDGADMRVYVDGVVSGSSVAQTGNIMDSFGSILIPSNTVDDVQIYNRVLSADEIRKIYSQGTQRINTSLNNRQTKDLVGLWSLDGNDVTDKVYDRSGQSNNGTFVGGSTSTAKVIGKIGQAMSFDGVNDKISIADSDILDNTNKLTASFWIKPSILDGSARGVISKRVDATSEIAYSFFMFTENRLFIDIANVTDRFSTNTVFQVGNWYHVVVVYDGTLASNQRTKVYVNGALDITGTDTDTTIPNRNSVLSIGQLLSSGYFSGNIDDVRIYNNSLSANEVSKLYNLGR